MKAVIVELSGKYAVALKKNGEFVKIPNRSDYKVGYEIDLAAGRLSALSSMSKYTAVAAVLILVTGISLGAYTYSVPYSYINIDINPSVMLTANRFDRVIDVRSLNQDGDIIISDKKLKNMKVDEAVDCIIEGAFKTGYLQGEAENAVLLTVSGKESNKVKGIKETIGVSVQEELVEKDIEAEVAVLGIDLEEYRQSEELGVSPGKLNLVEKLVEANKDIDAEEMLKASVKDIMEAVKEIRKNIETGKIINADKQKEKKKGNGNAKSASEESEYIGQKPKTAEEQSDKKMNNGSNEGGTDKTNKNRGKKTYTKGSADNSSKNKVKLVDLNEYESENKNKDKTYENYKKNGNKVPEAATGKNEVTSIKSNPNVKASIQKGTDKKSTEQSNFDTDSDRENNGSGKNNKGSNTYNGNNMGNSSNGRNNSDKNNCDKNNNGKSNTDNNTNSNRRINGNGGKNSNNNGNGNNNNSNSNKYNNKNSGEKSDESGNSGNKNNGNTSNSNKNKK